MSPARSILRRTLASLLSPRFLIGSIVPMLFPILIGITASWIPLRGSGLVPPVHAEAGTLDLKASTASYSGTMTQAGNQPIRTAFGPLRFDYKSGPNAWTTGFLIREGDGNVTIGANITSADFNSNSKLRVLGIIESTTGGIKFPDGTTQTSAASGNVSGWTDGGTSVYLTTGTDNVGIGTTGPQSLLHVRGSATIGYGNSEVNNRYIINPDTGIEHTYGLNDGNATANHGRFSLANNVDGTVESGNNSGGLKLRNNSGSWAAVIGDSSTTGGLEFFVGGTSTNQTYNALSASSAMIINSTGNVGIGTTAPTQKLDVNGYIAADRLYSRSSSTNMLNMYNGGVSLESYLSYRIQLDNDNNDSTEEFLVDTNGGGTRLLTVKADGNVGIGSTTPGAKLEVAGNINSSTGALQTNGVTRIANDGVGTFAAGTTIGGAAVGGETAGQIAFFATTCPTGWTEYTALRGRVPVGTPLSGTNAGTAGTALTNLEDRTHSHSFSASTSSVGGSVTGDTCGCGPGASWGTPTHSHSASGTSETSVTSYVIPYIQLIACQKS